tara:strand:+ start:759 stop:932 length:174 start_codon:yes stop_codon:yes gene_type:complete
LFYKINNMKESILIKMKYDLKLTQEALMVALHRIEKLEQQLKPKEDATIKTKEVRDK